MPGDSMRSDARWKSLSAIGLAAVSAAVVAWGSAALGGEAPPPAFGGEAPPPKGGGEAGKKEAGDVAKEPGKAGEKAAEAEEFTEDLIILKSGVGITGKVIRQTKDAVKVEVATGTFWIAKASIERIEFNLASRLAELADDDYAGRYELAMQALQMGQAAQARGILDGLVGKTGVPPEIYETLAEMYEEEGDLKKALEYLKRYEMSNPGDKKLKEKIAELKKKLRDSGGGGAGGGPAAASANDGLEVGGTWSSLNWGNPTQTSLQNLEGDRALMIAVAAGGRGDKAAVGRFLRLKLDDKTKFRFRAFNAEKKPVELAVAIITSTFYESRPVQVRPDWNMDLSINLKSKKFKCQETNWRYEAEIDDLDKVKQIIFLIYTGKRKALLYLDNIRAE